MNVKCLLSLSILFCCVNNAQMKDQTLQINESATSEQVSDTGSQLMQEARHEVDFILDFLEELHEQCIVFNRDVVPQLGLHDEGLYNYAVLLYFAIVTFNKNVEKINSIDQSLLWEQVAKYYGNDFAQEFADLKAAVKPSLSQDNGLGAHDDGIIWVLLFLKKKVFSENPLVQKIDTLSYVQFYREMPAKLEKFLADNPAFAQAFEVVNDFLEKGVKAYRSIKNLVETQPASFEELEKIACFPCSMAY